MIVKQAFLGLGGGKKEVAKAGGGLLKKTLVGLGVAGAAGGGVVAGKHLANKNDPALARKAFNTGYDVGQEETANAIYNQLASAGMQSKSPG